MTTRIDIARYASPIGEISLASVAGKLVHLDFEGNDERLRTIQSRRFRQIDWQENGAAPASVIRWLDAYFAGEVLDLPMVDILMIGTDFQKRLWRALIVIPCGECRTYGGLAVELGNPKAVRAVARATALNPVAIIVPCHRVIGADGRLTGYAGGLDRKRWLLEHEAVALLLRSRSVLAEARGRGLCPPAGSSSDADVAALLARGEKLLAIRLYRELHGCGLKEAREAVEVMARGGRPPGA